MASGGLRDTSLSTETSLDAGQDVSSYLFPRQLVPDSSGLAICDVACQHLFQFIISTPSSRFFFL